MLWKSIYIYNCNLLLLRKSFALVKHWKKLQIRLVPAHFTCFVRNYFLVWKIIHLHINLLDVFVHFLNNDNDVVRNSTIIHLFSKNKKIAMLGRKNIQRWLVIVKREWHFPIPLQRSSFLLQLICLIKSTIHTIMIMSCSSWLSHGL